MSRAPRRPTPAGVLVVDKPLGPTSHDVVDWVRWALRAKRVGHCGTLDPAASGLLVVCVGAATKLAGLITGADKIYAATFVLGRSTTTADGQGETIAIAACDAAVRAGAGEALHSMAGALSLPPPVYSAVHVDGERAHARARRGEAVTLAPRPMRIDSISGVRVVPALDDDGGTVQVHATLAVAKGTYVRALAEELGRRLGVPAHLGALRRIGSGTLRLPPPPDDACVQVADVDVVGPLVASCLGPAPGGKGQRWRIRAAGMEDADRDAQGAWLTARRRPPWVALPIPVITLTPAPRHTALLAQLGHGQAVGADALAWDGAPPTGEAAIVAPNPAGGDATVILVVRDDALVRPRKVVSPPAPLPASESGPDA